MFEPSAEVIRKGKASKPTEFGKLLKLQEAENQIVVDYEVFAQRPSDMDLLIPAIDVHQAKLGRVPRLVAADGALTMLGFVFAWPSACSVLAELSAAIPALVHSSLSSAVAAPLTPQPPSITPSSTMGRPPRCPRGGTTLAYEDIRKPLVHRSDN